MSYAQKVDTRTEAELLQSTRRTLAEADESANRTLGTLHGQTEQLERIQDDTESIRSNLDASDRLLKSMRPLGWLRDMFRGDGHRYRRSSGSGAAPPAPAPAAVRGGASSAAASAPSGLGAGASRLLADEAARQGSRPVGRRPDQQASELDRAYDDIDHMLDGLKHKAAEINRTLDHHNQVLPQIMNSVDREDERIKKQQREMKKRLG